MLAGLLPIASLVFGTINTVNQLDAAGEAKKQLEAKQTQEQALIDAQKKELAQEQAQQELITTRNFQEKSLADLAQKNSPSTNPIAFSSLGGLKGKLG